MKVRPLLLALTVACGAAASAQNIAVTINDEPVRFGTAGPRTVDGRVLVPLRGVFEALGAFVEWVPSRRTVVANKGNIDLELRIGDRIARVNGRDVLLDVPAVIYSGTTMVPLRFVSETLGAEVSWDAPNRTVAIMTTDATRPTEPTTTPAGGTGALPQITSFNIEGDGWLRGSQDLRVVMTGTPGGSASFEIPGVLARPVSMREVSSGRYEGTWRPGTASNLTGATVIGRLEVNGRERLIQAGQNLSIDTTAPRIRNVIPDRSRIANPRPTISVTFDDAGGSGIDQQSVRLVVNGQDVTRQAQIGASYIDYMPPRDLPAGENRVELTAADKAGNTVNGSWTFTITDVRDIVKNITTNIGNGLEPGDVLTVRMEGEPGGRATFSVGNIVVDRAMRETQPGIYVGEYTIRKGDRFDNAPISATLTTTGGLNYNIESGDRFKLDTGTLGAPKITAPAANGTVTGPMVVRGTAEPGARLRVRVEYATNTLGVLRLTGAVYDRIIQADAQGQWTTGNIELGSVAGQRGTNYTIRAIPVDAQGNEGEAVVLRAQRG